MFITRLLVIIIFLGLTSQAFSQDKEYSSPDEPFVQKAISELNFAQTPPKGSLYIFATEKKLTGRFTFDLTIRGKGEMATVFAVSTEGSGTIKMQNLLKDWLKAYQFSFRMPKGKSYKFQYTFQFN
jgi:hypothetical protein